MGTQYDELQEGTDRTLTTGREEEEDGKTKTEENVVVRDELLLLSGPKERRHVVLEARLNEMYDEIDFEGAQKGGCITCPSACGMGGGAFGNCTCLFLWIVAWLLLTSALQLRLYTLDRDMKHDVQESAHRYLAFHWFFPLLLLVLTVILTSAFCTNTFLFRRRISLLIGCLASQASDQIHYELRDICLDEYKSFRHRLQKAFEVEENHTRMMKALLDRIPEQLDEGLDDLVDDMEATCMRSTFYLTSTLRKVIYFGMYFFPNILCFIANISLIIIVWRLRFGRGKFVPLQSPRDIGRDADLAFSFSTPGFQLIGAALLMNGVAWFYLVIVNSNCIQHIVSKLILETLKDAATDTANDEIDGVWHSKVLVPIQRLLPGEGGLKLSPEALEELVSADSMKEAQKKRTADRYGVGETRAVASSTDAKGAEYQYRMIKTAKNTVKWEWVKMGGTDAEEGGRPRTTADDGEPGSSTSASSPLNPRDHRVQVDPTPPRNSPQYNPGP